MSSREFQPTYTRHGPDANLNQRSNNVAWSGSPLGHQRDADLEGAILSCAPYRLPVAEAGFQGCRSYIQERAAEVTGADTDLPPPGVRG